MNALNILLFFLPLIALLIISTLPRTSEKLIVRFVIASIISHITLVALITFMHISSILQEGYYAVLWDVYDYGRFSLKMTLLLDKINLPFIIVTDIIFLLALQFSKYYMHRDEGFKRYFFTIALYIFAWHTILISGNFETLFVGWEIKGFCSLVLIGFYRQRYLPVKNAFKVISLFRISDILLIVVMWGLHNIFHQNISFLDIKDAIHVNAHTVGAPQLMVIVIIALILAAMIKSGQYPFSSWVPRAMEGPSTSSAIFYGAFSIHAGVFLLIRTHHLWEENMVARICIGGIGLITAMICNNIAKHQSTVKTQIGYASVAQIGILFIEIALGWYTLAIIHFIGNAFLRTYQFLLSPSVLHYRIHHQHFHHQHNTEIQPISRAASLAIAEWNMDTWHYTYLWSPFKKISKAKGNIHDYALPLVGLILVVATAFIKQSNSVFLVSTMCIALLILIKALGDGKSVLRNILLVMFSQCLIGAAYFLVKPMPFLHILMYGAGIICGLLLSLMALYLSKSWHRTLDAYHGMAYLYNGHSNLFIVGLLAMSGFPIASTFLAIDLFYYHTTEWYIIMVYSLYLLFIELVYIRMYSKIFLGPHDGDHPSAYTSS